jgi:hypothetical protein|nr:MAG TPA: hypothetical protein [Caudoviricetes sp.]
MTKEEFKGFSSAAQHDMVLEALVRITKNLETMEKESGKPFMGTTKQRRNDVKLLTILAEAFGKNELVWARNGERIPRGKELSNFSLYTGIGQKVHTEEARVPMDAGRLTPSQDKVYITTGETIRGNGKHWYSGIEQKVHTEELNPIKDIMDAKEKIEGAQQRSGHFMSFDNKES